MSKVLAAFKSNSGQWVLAKLPVKIDKSNNILYPKKVFYLKRHYELSSLKNRALYKEVPLMIEHVTEEEGMEEKLKYLNDRLDAQQNQIAALVEVSQDYASIIKLLNSKLKDLTKLCEELDLKH